MGVSSLIARTNKDAHGNKLDRSIFDRMYRLRQWNFRSQACGATNLHRAFQELYKLKDKLGLADAVIEKAAYIYRKAKERRITHGRSTAAILAAAAYIACRELEAPKTLNDIATMANMKRKSLSREYRLLVTELDLKIPIVDPMKCIAKIANKSYLSEKQNAKHLP